MAIVGPTSPFVLGSRGSRIAVVGPTSPFVTPIIAGIRRGSRIAVVGPTSPIVNPVIAKTTKMLIN
jgi:hypothetical protein